MGDIGFLDRAAPAIIVGADKDGAETFPADVNERQELEVTDGIKSEIKSFALTVGTTAIEVIAPSEPIDNKKGVLIFNNSNRTMWWGDSSVTISSGIPLGRGENVNIRSEGVSIYIVSDQAGQNLRAVEYK